MLSFFKKIALLEGISLLVLLFFAMPMKYIYHYPEYVKTVGMAHGILFIAYMLLAIWFKINQKWSFSKFCIISIAAFLPFGTFYMEKKYL